MRLRTLPVSTAGVAAACAVGYREAGFRWGAAAICLVFAVLCQIASNFANEYYDFRAGLDRPGRSGPRRGVTEGDLSAEAMKRATYLTLFLALVSGLSLITWGGFWLIPVGALIAIGAICYSAGPYPLSHHGLGEGAVFIFFGLIPVNFTYFLTTGQWSLTALLVSVSIGLMGANVLIVNNYRDADEDREVGKRTLATIFGRTPIRLLYLLNGIMAAGVSFLASNGSHNLLIASAVYLALHLALWTRMKLNEGDDASRLNPLLGMTAVLMLFYAALLFI